MKRSFIVLLALLITSGCSTGRHHNKRLPSSSDYVYECEVKASNNTYRFVFDLDRYQNSDQVLIEVFKNNKIIHSYLAEKEYSRDSHGDQYSVSLQESRFGIHEYNIQFDVQYPTGGWAKLPATFGKKDFKKCKRIKV